MKRYIENFLSKLHGKSISQLPRYFKKVTPSRSSYLNAMQALVSLSIVLGTLISALGFYGLASGKGITFAVTDGTINIDPALAGMLISLAGILLTFEGVALVKVSLETSQLIIFSIVLGYCTLNIPAILLGVGHSLLAGILAIIFGYFWLITVFAWLQRGE
ncbi:MAG: hypothetical protein QMD23_01155 [Candidatus Bathyarchaeia archaeon]|nr:hypothetical protein [Candidatus Bathyarchaeia archaeon]